MTTAAEADVPARPTGSRWRTWLRLGASVASLALAAWLVVEIVPTVGGVDWATIGDRMSDVGPLALLGLTALWLAGLWAYTYVLTGSLPGLRNSQAFSLNAAGSAVSNLLPFGGAAGVAVTAVMAASWGHSVRAIASSTIVSGLWNALGRVALPLVALAIQGAAVFGQGVLAATLGTAAVLTAVVIALTRLRWLSGVLRGRARRFVVRLRRQNAAVVRNGWSKMTLGLLAYLVLQALLLWCCLAVTGTELPLPALIAAFAVSRLLTLAVITPGGFGVSENGTIALLVALGTPAAPAVAGVLLFAVFTFLAEIPLGGAAWLTWSVRRARSG
ncbi:lysylphosphatidylglycerol synthase transmembrane domain-containing protein [Actinosynnema sp. NPDC023587]|uniref:lysylphosphatidylglycerol synthase transmembrane domain-containing protein n=1 Tax=Actinosynnema sp. NPDC023587 TaxID=3154695 RepID=UPI0033E91382